MLRKLVVVAPVMAARIDMDRHRVQPAERVEQRVPDVLRNGVPVRHGAIAVNRDVKTRLKGVTDPADPNRIDPLDAVHAGGCPLHVGDELRLYGVHEAAEDLAGRVAEDEEDRDRDKQADDRIRLGEAEPYAAGGGEEAERGQTVGAGVVAVGD